MSKRPVVSVACLVILFAALSAGPAQATVPTFPTTVVDPHLTQLGGIGPDMTQAEVEARWGTPETPCPSFSGYTTCEYGTSDHTGNAAVSYENGVLQTASVEVTDPATAHPAFKSLATAIGGYGIGSTDAAGLIAAYPGGYESTDSYGYHYSVRSCSNGGTTEFAYRTGTGMTFIHIANAYSSSPDPVDCIGGEGGGGGGKAKAPDFANDVIDPKKLKVGGVSLGMTQSKANSVWGKPTSCDEDTCTWGTVAKGSVRTTSVGGRLAFIIIDVSAVAKPKGALTKLATKKGEVGLGDKIGPLKKAYKGDLLKGAPGEPTYTIPGKAPGTKARFIFADKRLVRIELRDESSAP